MKKRQLFVYLCFVVTLFGCAEKTTDPAEVTNKTANAKALKDSDLTIHSARAGAKVDGPVGFSTVISKQILPDFPSMTFGKAIERYSHFEKTEWRETFLKNEKMYVDFIGWKDSKKIDAKLREKGITAQGIEIKFMIVTDKPFSIAMVSRLESTVDGKISAYPLVDVKGILNALYENKEISF